MSDRRYKILLVDDEVDLLEIIASILELEGYAVVKANSVPKALECITSEPPDIIVSDITMPGQSGFDLLANVRSHSQLQNIPFLFLSAHADIESIKTGKELGIDDYLTKPVDFYLLLSTIKGKLKRKEELSQAFQVQSEQFKNQIFRLISHEMRTPLTSILGATELLSDTKEQLSEQDLKAFLEMLQNSSKRLTSMVDDFLTAMRIESGEIIRESTMTEHIINPYRTVDHLLQEMKSKMEVQRVEVINSCPADSIPVVVYLPHLENMLGRLADNAVKFSNPGSVVTISMRQDERGVTFIVKDNGCGIPKEKQDLLYAKFQQVNRDKNEQQGTGLGLYIASQLAKLNKAHLWFESEEGKGSTFYLQIPKPAGL